MAEEVEPAPGCTWTSTVATRGARSLHGCTVVRSRDPHVLFGALPGTLRACSLDHGGESTRFELLVAEWMRKHDLRADQLVRTQRRVCGVHMLGGPYHRSWCEYHARHAVLRRIRPRAHREKTREVHRRQMRRGGQKTQSPPGP